MECETLRDQERTASRRRFLKASAAVLLLNEAGRAGIGELLAPQTISPDFQSPRTLEELEYVVRRELQTSIRVIPQPPDLPENGAGSLLDLPVMATNGIHHASETGVLTIPSHVKEFLDHYGEQEQSLASAFVRCNNNAHDACRTFSRYGLPMHLLALAPPIRHFFSQDWHVMAVCPLQGRIDGTSAHLLFDNRTPILWRHGNLGAFVSWYEQGSPPDARRWIPPRGIARYREPEHTITHPLLMHVGHAVSEKDMEALKLDTLDPRGRMPILA